MLNGGIKNKINMTQEEKQLLLKDLCARLPYKVKARFCNGVKEERGDVWDIDMFSGAINVDYIIDDVKPYLRPMSSMTEEEYEDLCNSCTWLWFKDDLRTVTHGDHKCYDWLNAHHFDYRGLIEMGLALEAPKRMYKNE